MSQTEIITLSNKVKDRIEQNNYDKPKWSIYSNTWPKFLGYLIYRNKGYGFRKVYNITTELFELGCLAYIIDIHFLKSILILPLINIASGYLQEYHNQLYRGTKNTVLNKFFLILVSLFILGGVSTITYQEAKLHSLLIFLFIIRSLVIFFQCYFNLKNIDFLAFNRIRPNIKSMWLSLALASTASGLIVFSVLNPILKIIIISLLFSIARLIPDYLFYRIVQDKIYSLRYINYLKSKPAEQLKHILGEIIFITIHLCCLLAFSYKFKNLNSYQSVGITFLVLTFYDRIINRPFKSMSLDILRLFYSNQRSYALNILTRLNLIAISILFVSILSLALTSKFTFDQLSALFLIFLTFMLNNLILSCTTFKNINANTRYIYFYIILTILSICFLFSPFYSLNFFAIFSIINLLVGYAFIAKSNRFFNEENRLIYNSKNTLIKDKNFKLFIIEWDNLNNHWQDFIKENKLAKNFHIHINRKIKIFFVKESDVFLKLVDKFPLNVNSVNPFNKSIIFPKMKTMNKGNLIYLDWLGFWLDRSGKKVLFPDNVIKELNLFNSYWINRKLLTGGKTEFQIEDYTFSIASFDGNILWYKKKGEKSEV